MRTYIFFNTEESGEPKQPELVVKPKCVGKSKEGGNDSVKMLLCDKNGQKEEATVPHYHGTVTRSNAYALAASVPRNFRMLCGLMICRSRCLCVYALKTPAKRWLLLTHSPHRTW